jgi:hypothetical protein
MCKSVVLARSKQHHSSLVDRSCAHRQPREQRRAHRADVSAAYTFVNGGTHHLQLRCVRIRCEIHNTFASAQHGTSTRSHLDQEHTSRSLTSIHTCSARSHHGCTPRTCPAEGTVESLRPESTTNNEEPLLERPLLEARTSSHSCLILRARRVRAATKHERRRGALGLQGRCQHGGGARAAQRTRA